MADGVEVGTAYVTVLPSAKGFGNALQSQIAPGMPAVGEKAGKSVSSGLLVGLKGIAGPLAALFAVGKVTGFFTEAIGEARESQKVGAITANAIRATGGAAKISADQVGDLATSISNKTGIDDEAVQSGANLLLTFKNVRNEVGQGNDVFNQATTAATDLSAAGFGSIEGASKMLGKALNDPIKGMTALGKSGVTFTDAQKTQVAALVKQGDVLGAQKIILGEVNAQVGGAAAASATAGEKLAVQWGNFKEQIGTALLPVLDKAMTGIGGVVTFLSTNLGPAVDKATTAYGSLKAGLDEAKTTFDENRTKIEVIAGVITALLLPGLVGLAAQATVTAASQVAAWFTTGAASVRSAAVQFASGYKVIGTWVAQAAAAVASGAETVAVWALLAADSIRHSATSALAWVRSTATTIASWVAMKASAVASAVASFVSIAAGAVVSGAASAASWVASTAATVASWVAMKAGAVASAVASFAGIAAAAVANAAVSSATWVASNIRTAASFLIVNAALVASKVAMIAGGIATKAYAVGQWLLNAALTANPIGIVVVAIAALVAGLIYAYRHSETFRNIVNAVGLALKTGFIAAVAAVKIAIAALVTAFRAVAAATSAAWAAIKAAVSAALNAVRSTVSGALITVKAAFSTAWNAMKSATVTAFNAVRTAVSGSIGKVLGLVKSLPGKVLSALSGLGTLLLNAGKSLVQGLIDGIMSKISGITDAASAIATKIRSFFPGSPVKSGPLTSWNNGGAGQRLGGLLASGLDASASGVRAASLRLAGNVATPALQPAARGATAAAAGAASGSAGPDLAGLVQQGMADFVRSLNSRDMHVIVQQGTAFGRSRGGGR